MKCSIAAIFVLATWAVAKPMPAKGKGASSRSADAGSAADVSASIDAWLQDIKDVNTFVDTAGDLENDEDISDAAATALVAAQDEGTQNDALADLTDLDASGLAANADLANQFDIIGPAIEDTITNPQNLQQNLDAINGARCPGPVGNGAIFEEGAVQQSAAADAGVDAALPELPAACGMLAEELLDAAR